MAEENIAQENDGAANSGSSFGGPGPGIMNRGNEQYINDSHDGALYPQGDYRGNNFSQDNYRGKNQNYPQGNYRDNYKDNYRGKKQDYPQGNYRGDNQDHPQGNYRGDNQDYPQGNYRGNYQGYPQGNYRGNNQGQDYSQGNFRGNYQSQGYPQGNFRGNYQSQGYPQGSFNNNYQGFPRRNYRSGYLPFGGRSAVGNNPYGTRYGNPYPAAYGDFKYLYDYNDGYDYDYDYDFDHDDRPYYQNYGPVGYGPNGQPYGGYGPMNRGPVGFLRNWISYNPVTNWARSPRGNNFLRGLGIATAGIILAPAIIRTIRPLAVQAVHGAMSIVGEVKGVVSDAKEELEDIFADAKWENLNSREEKLQD